ncbi:hypothetical protein [Persephonella sp.]
MCDKDVLFCIFYYLGFFAIGGALFAGWFIFTDYMKYKKELEENQGKGE